MTAVTTTLSPAADARLRRGLAAVCMAAGIEPQHPQLLKYTINAVYRVGDCVVRLARGSLAEARAARVVRVAEEFTRRGVPVVRLVDGIDQPIRTDGWVATVWIHVPTTGERPHPAQLAGPLRAIHAIDDVRLDLPAWTPIAKALDGVAIGPREWDLTPVAHGAERFGRPPEDYQAFAAEYGFDITGWAGWPVLRDVRELQLVTSVLDNIAGRPDVAEQLALRLNSILKGDRTVVWTRYR